MTAGRQTQWLTKTGCELEELYYTKRERTHTVPTAGSRRKRCTYQKHTTERLDRLLLVWPSWSLLLCLFIQKAGGPEIGTAVIFFLFSLAYDWKGLERKWEKMDIFSPGVMGKLRTG